MRYPTGLGSKIRARLEGLHGDAHPCGVAPDAPGSAHARRQAIDFALDDALATLDSYDDDEAAALHQALDRIDRGIYGRCISCGEAISDARLNAIPDTKFCRQCAHKAVAR